MARILIRHSTPADLQGIIAIYAQEHAYGNTLQLPYPSEKLWEQRLAEASQSHFNLVALLDEQIVGQISLIANTSPRRRHTATFGMGVSGAHTGAGIGTQLLAAVLDLADNWLNLRRVEIEVYTDNEAAIALYRKHGFEIEGTCRDYAFRNGQYVDAHVMARIRESGDPPRRQE